MTTIHRFPSMALKSVLSALVLIGFLSIPERAYADIAIIVHPDNKETIDLNAVIRIYLGQVARFPGGSEATPVALPDGSKVRGELNLALLQAAPANIKASWAQRQFSGGLKPLPTYNNDEAVIKAVAETPNGIGYVDAARVRGNVRVALKL